MDKKNPLPQAQKSLREIRLNSPRMSSQEATAQRRAMMTIGQPVKSGGGKKPRG
jgi:hypothetical protein